MALLRSEIMHANPRTCLIWWRARLAKWINREALWDVLWAALESRLFQAAAPGGGGSPLSCMQISSWVISGALWTSSHVHTYLCTKAKNTGAIMLEALEVIKTRSLHVSNEMPHSITGKDKVKIWKKDCQICQIDKRSPREELSPMQLCNSCLAKTCREACKVENWKQRSLKRWQEWRKNQGRVARARNKENNNNSSNKKAMQQKDINCWISRRRGRCWQLSVDLERHARHCWRPTKF